MKVLVIWELIPEETKMYEIEAGEEYAKELELCHGKHLNTVGLGDEVENALDQLDEKLSSLDEIKGPYRGKPDMVISCGFIL